MIHCTGITVSFFFLCSSFLSLSLSLSLYIYIYIYVCVCVCVCVCVSFFPFFSSLTWNDDDLLSLKLEDIFLIFFLSLLVLRHPFSVKLCHVQHQVHMHFSLNVAKDYLDPSLSAASSCSPLLFIISIGKA